MPNPEHARGPRLFIGVDPGIGRDRTVFYCQRCNHKLPCKHWPAPVADNPEREEERE